MPFLFDFHLHSLHMCYTGAKKQNNCQNNCVYLELHNTIKIISTKKCDGFYLQLYPRSLFSFFYLQHKLLEVSSVQLFLFQLKQTQSRLLQIIRDAFCHQEVLTSVSEELHAQQLSQGKATWILGEDRYNNHLCCTLSACNLPNQSWQNACDEFQRDPSHASAGRAVTDGSVAGSWLDGLEELQLRRCGADWSPAAPGALSPL